MSATTRWVQYDISQEGEMGDGGGVRACRGTRGYSLATAGTGQDTFDIGAGNNRLHFAIEGDGEFVVLASGTALDPRFVAKDITEKIHNLGKADDAFDFAQCVWENNAMKLYAGTLGATSSVAVSSGTNSAHLELGWGTETAVGGSNNNSTGGANTYNAGITISGTYSGFFDEMYRIVMRSEYNINTPVKGGTNSYTGAINAAGVFNNGSDITYSIFIDVTNGTTMGGGTGNVPTMTWTSTASADDSSASVELLYPDYWYKLGTKGAMVKFSDAVFNTCADPNYAWTVECNYPQYVQGSNVQAAAGTAMYIWGSTRGEYSASAITAQESSFTRLGSRGIYIKFSGSGANFQAGDEFQIICKPPQPQSYDITNLNYGNVTVSTESPVRAVLFEIESGAVEISTVKFGLQSHGSFSHHDESNNDTKFRYGTVGPGNTAGGSPVNGLEWRANVTSADIASDTPPAYLYATKEDLAVVSDADNSEDIGASTDGGMCADPIWLGVKLGASEVGANSTINYRIFFDYS